MKITNTKAIVISTIKYGDTSLIASCYTENYGLKTYLLKGILKAKKSKIKAAYFQPLTQLNITANHHNKGTLNYIKEVAVAHFSQTIYTDIKKQTIALFLSEILYAAIREEEQNEALYKYLETAFLWLDTHSEVANFHLLFLLNLTKFLGFYPETNLIENNYFNLVEGAFTNQKDSQSISGENLKQFKKLLGINFDVLHQVNFNAANRQAILSILIQYFELHLNGFKKPKSLSVLKVIFS